MLNIWDVEKPIIGMVHLACLIGQEGYKGSYEACMKAYNDAKALKNGGIDGILVENWEDDSPNFKTREEDKIYAEQQYTSQISLFTSQLVRHIKLPTGVNVLPNDYKSSFSIAKLTGAQFIQLDVYVDEVRTNYIHSPVEDFEIKLNPDDVVAYREKIKAKNIALFASIQPKHYTMLDKEKDILTSANQAIEKGADVIVVTGDWTGEAPNLDILKRVKKHVGDFPVFIGSGLDKDNTIEFLGYADGAIVGTSLKVEGITENPVDEERVKEIMEVVSSGFR